MQLRPADLPALARLLEGHPRGPSEYSIANIFLFRNRHDYRLIEGSVPAITGLTYDGERHCMPLGNLTAENAAELLRYADCIYPLDEFEARALVARTGWSLDHREEDSDYLYHAPAMARLAGAKAQRLHRSAFERSAPRAVAMDAAHESTARQVLADWRRDLGRATGYADDAECAEAINMFGLLQMEGIVVFVEAEAVGLLLMTRRPAQLIIHFAKGRRAHRGVYPWMFSYVAATGEVPELNFEQDLGKSGLRQAKRALSPVELRRKYRVRR